MFAAPDYQEFIQLNGTFSLNMLLISFLVIVFASYTTLVLYDRMRKPSFFKREVWLLLASLSLSFGVWSTHFIIVNSISLPVEVKVHYGWAFVAIVPMFLGALIAFRLVQVPVKACWRHVVGALSMVWGISVMHYLAMKSITLNAHVDYDWKLLIIGGLIVAPLAYLGLRNISSRNHTVFSQILAVSYLVVGTLVMHSLVLKATTYYVEVESVTSESIMHMEFMNAFIGVGVGLLLVSMLLTSYIDGYVDYWLKYFDVLTKLPNRRNWERCLTDDLSCGDIAIWNFPDLPRINQLYGYEAGDEILQEIGETLSKWKPPYAQLFRVSGNRYLFCVHTTGKSADFYNSLTTMQREIGDLLPIKRQEMRYTCGLAKADQKKTVKQLYKDALKVVEKAAEEREWGLLTFDTAIHGVSHEQDVLRDISTALDEGHIYMVYQPKVRGSNNEFVGVEALLRWTHPDLGPVAPAMFVPVLEQDGRMGEVTDWIIRRVCRQIHDWDTQAIHVPQVAINIPGQHITEPHLLDLLWKETNAYGLDPARIELEVTETSTTKSIPQAIAAMKRFKRYGFSVALDDFGTGVSSLSYLQQLPITTLKIDKSFTDVVPAPAKKCAVLNAILAIGRSMDLDIIVEGVEQKEQVDFLLELQSDLIFQGYYFSRPLMVPDLESWIVESNKSELYPNFSKWPYSK